jgi:hypothetical protein
MNWNYEDPSEKDGAEFIEQFESNNYAFAN